MQWADAFVERTGVLELLGKGWHHVTIDTFRHRMNEEGLRVSRAYQKFLVEELGFKAKANLVGMSWGGFFSTRYASRYPDCVSKIYLDAPLLVLDRLRGLPEADTVEKAERIIGPWARMGIKCGEWKDNPEMPVNLAERLAKTGIPILLLYGGEDQTVPPELNSEVFIERFKAAGGKINVKRRYLFGHHPHGEERGRTEVITRFFED
jgi:pimeloyl-ACP methyl ester carboxylesterase